MSTSTRSKAQDAIAATIIFGGTTVAHVGFYAGAITTAVATDLVSRSAANSAIRAMSRYSGRHLGYMKREAWNYYKRTGDRPLRCPE